MFSNLSDIIKIPAAIIVGMIIASVSLILSYEGINLPLIGQVIDGRVATEVRAAKSTMVTTFERDTLASQLMETQRLLSEANRTAVNAKARAEETLKAKNEAEARADVLAREAASNKKLSYPSDEDKAWNAAH